MTSCHFHARRHMHPLLRPRALVLLLPALLAAASCSSASAGSWRLTFADEFNGDALNTSAWQVAGKFPAIITALPLVSERHVQMRSARIASIASMDTLSLNFSHDFSPARVAIRSGGHSRLQRAGALHERSRRGEGRRADSHHQLEPDRLRPGQRQREDPRYY